MRPSPTRRFILLASLFSAVLFACGREVTGPDGKAAGLTRVGRIAFNTIFPEFASQIAGTTVEFEKVRIVLRRADGSIALERIVDFPSGSSELSLSLSVTLAGDAPAAGEPMVASLEYLNTAGQTVFQGSSNIVVPASTPGAPAPTPVSIPVVYKGVGSEATSVVISPRTANATPGDVINFGAQAIGANGPIPGTPITFVSSDATRASVAANGQVTIPAAAPRGTVRISARLLTGPTDDATITINPRAASLQLASGGNQSGTGGATLAQQIAVRVLASDGQGIAGTTVTFAAANGGSVSPTTAVSDASGLAQTRWTLGPSATSQSMTATAAGLTGSPLTVNATATILVATQLAFTTPPSNGNAGAPLGTIAVTARDVNGNTVPTFSNAITLALGANPGGATLGGTVTATPVNGVATFTGLTLNRVGSAYTLVASAAGLPNTTSVPFDIAAGTTQRLVFTSTITSPQAAGILVAPAITVAAQDALGNAVTSFTGLVTLSVGSNPGNATATGAAVNAVNGVATFPAFTLNRPGNGYTLLASSPGMSSGTSGAFDVTVGPPASMLIFAGNAQSRPAGTTLNPIDVQVRDPAGNGVPGATVNFAIASGGGSLTPASAATDAAGLARVNWTLGPVAGPQSITATSPAVSGTTLTITANAAIGTATQLAITTAPQAAQIAGIGGTPIVVAARDATGNTVPGFTSPVVMTIASGPSGATVIGPTAINAVAGVATFSGVSFDKAGNYTLTFASSGVTSVTSTSFTVNAGAAANIVADSGLGQNGTVGIALPQPFVVRVTDTYGNPVTGTTIGWAVTAGGGSLGGTAMTTNGFGRARTTLTLGATAGLNTVTATSGGLTGSPVTFNATSAAASASLLVLNAAPQSVQTAGTSGTPIIVHARDGSGNLATAFNGTVLMTIASGPGGATIIGPSSVNALSGVATFGGVSFDKAGNYTLTFAASG
ncbi:MAG: Ig-like domain-containing protein, partial [Gemmatimonadaceae bacterium]|nr:Ig-like domain-containing protein [Gemmatimonadaceae bacterium]